MKGCVVGGYDPAKDKNNLTFNLISKLLTEFASSKPARVETWQ